MRTVLITGASSGLGRASARMFHERGWNVIATMRSTEDGAELSDLQDMLVTRLDVQEPESIAAAVDAGLTRFGRIDALINNAGYGAYGALELTPMEKMRRQFDVNVLGLLATTQAVLPHFRENSSGVIVNVSSVGGRITFPLGTLYHGSKFAVEGISEALQYELAEIGVRVKIVEPGGMITDFGGRSLDFSNDPAATEYQRLVGSVVETVGAMMENGSAPESIAETVYTAATDTSDHLRFIAGADAEEMLTHRYALEDGTFYATLFEQFGVTSPR